MENSTNHSVTIEKYSKHASTYDQSAERTMPIRLQTIAHLNLRAGDTVLDVGCGTGLSFSIILEKIGPTGILIGVELSPEMAEQSRNRINENQWKNVILINSSLEDAKLNDSFDAVLFNYTHDVLQSDVALENIFKNTKTDARISIAGMKLLPPLLSMFNFYVRKLARPYMNDISALDRPWKKIFPYLKDTQFKTTSFGAGYIAKGFKK